MAEPGVVSPADPEQPRDASRRDLAPETAVPVPLAEALADAGARAVRLDPGDDARALLPHLARLDVVEIAFPAFRDGRGYSAARTLREAGYRGTLRATGDVLVDQIVPMRRCGFDDFAPSIPLDLAAVRRALDRYAFVYQPAADGRPPAWRLRHG